MIDERVPVAQLDERLRFDEPTDA